MKQKRKVRWNYEGNFGSKVNLTTPMKTLKEARKRLSLGKRHKFWTPTWKNISIVKTYKGYNISGVKRK